MALHVYRNRMFILFQIASRLKSQVTSNETLRLIELKKKTPNCISFVSETLTRQSSNILERS